MQRRFRRIETENRFAGWRRGRQILAVSVCAVSLSACVSGSGLNLTSSADQQQVTTPSLAVLGDPNAQAQTVPAVDPGQPIVFSGVGVPVQAPRTTVAEVSTADGNGNQALAVVSETEQPVAGDVIANSTTGTQTEPSPTASTAAVAENSEELQIAAVTPTTQASVTGQPTSANEGKKLGLLARLFGGNGSKVKSKPRSAKNTGTNINDGYSRGGASRIDGAHRTAKTKKPDAKITVASRSQNTAAQGDALPGVKSTSELFGIDQAEIEEELRANSTQLASVGGFGRLSANGLRIQHEKVQVACLKPGVIRILKMVERRYGSKPIITSGYRSPKRNRRAGGARNSQHIFCKAVDIQVEGVSKWNLAKYLRTLPGRGGVGTYCRTKSVHLDIGSKRDWHHPCRRSKVKKRKKA